MSYENIRKITYRSTIGERERFTNLCTEGEAGVKGARERGERERDTPRGRGEREHVGW
jgi:hypothetical protein